MSSYPIFIFQNDHPPVSGSSFHQAPTDSRIQHRRYKCKCGLEWNMVSSGRSVKCKKCQRVVIPWEDPDLRRVSNQTRLHGYFWCPNKACGWEWNNWWSYARYPQKCPKCDAITFPFKQVGSRFTIVAYKCESFTKLYNQFFCFIGATPVCQMNSGWPRLYLGVRGKYQLNIIAFI